MKKKTKTKSKSKMRKKSNFKKVVVKPKVTVRKIKKVKNLISTVLKNRAKLPKGWKKL